MDNLTVIVTGASTGIGKEIARLFLNRGHNVILNASNEGNLAAAYAEFGSPNNATLLVGDIADKAVGDKLVKLAIDKYGSIDVLVNNAGVFQPKPFLEVDHRDLDRFLGINLKGTFYTTQAAIRQMLEQNGGV